MSQFRPQKEDLRSKWRTKKSSPDCISYPPSTTYQLSIRQLFRLQCRWRLRLLRLVKHCVPCILHAQAARERPPQRLRDGCWVGQVVVAEESSNVLRRLLRVVKRHLAEQVVAHVGVGDVVDHVVDDGAERSVHSAERAAEPVPLAAAEVRHEHVGVLQVGDKYEIGVGDHERH